MDAIRYLLRTLLRFRPQFALRTLLFLMLCIAGALAGFQFGYKRGIEKRQNEMLSARAYVVADLISEDAVSNPRAIATILAAIEQAVDPQSWISLGGQGSIAAVRFDPATVVIRQTESNHDAIAALLADWRKAKRDSQIGPALTKTP